MNFTGLIFVLLAHYFSGRGVMRRLNVAVSPVQELSLSMIIGVALISMVPCVLQLFGLGITTISVAGGIIVLTAVLCLPLLLWFRKPRFVMPRLPAMYEWPALLAVAVILVVSVWRCFYYPPTPRDMLTGPELIAEYAVREHTIASSVFSIDLHDTNNIFKSPFITGLQIIYKLLVCPFGQVWLSVVVVSFCMLLYSIARQIIHPVLAGLLLLFFVTIPDIFAYSFLMLYDYSNMVFFFCGFWFLNEFFRSSERKNFLLSALLFGLATYIRNETLVLVVLVLPYVAVRLLRLKLPSVKVGTLLGMLIVVPIVFYFLCMNVFVKNIIPVPFSPGEQVNTQLGDLSPFVTRLRDIFTVLIFSGTGLGTFGYFIYFFFAVVITDLIWPRQFSAPARTFLFGVAVVIIGLGLIGYLLPLADLQSTTKRGLFKLLPLMFLYICHSGAVLRLSGWVREWEGANFR